jgi:hypothetical protein
LLRFFFRRFSHGDARKEADGPSSIATWCWAKLRVAIRSRRIAKHHDPDKIVHELAAVYSSLPAGSPSRD